MALAETLLAQAGTLLDIASRRQTSETAEKMRDMAREFVELAHREAQVCSFPVVPMDPDVSSKEAAGGVKGCARANQPRFSTRLSLLAN
jgi:RNase H-fold protein (predicted Holliday junction resolvase)